MKNKEKSNKSIACDVLSCKYNNNECMLCNLENIKVSSVSDGKSVDTKKETICDSFSDK